MDVPNRHPTMAQYNAMPLSAAEKIALQDQLRSFSTPVSTIKDASSEVRNSVCRFSNAGQFLYSAARNTGRASEGMRDVFADSGNELQFHALPYLFSRLSQYIRKDEGSPVVYPAENADYGQHSPIQGREQEFYEAFGERPDSYIVAKILESRLELFDERSNSNVQKTYWLQTAAYERQCVVLVSYESDETDKEPANIGIIRGGDYWFDPDAKSIEDGRFCGYTEKEVTVSEVASRYGISIEDVEYYATSTDENSETSGILPEKIRHIDVNHWWIRNYDTMKRAGVEEHLIWDYPEGQLIEKQAKGFDEVWKYRGGWQYVCEINNHILYNGENPSPEDRPPMFVFSWWPYPGESVGGMSLYDTSKQYIQDISRLYRYTVTSTKRSMPFTVVDESKIQNPEAILSNRIQEILKVTPGADIHSVIRREPGGGHSQEFLEIAQILRQQMEDVVGASGIDMEDAARGDMSGDAIEGVKQDHSGIAASIRTRWISFLVDVYTCVLKHIVHYEDHSTSLNITTKTGKRETIPYNVGVIGSMNEDESIPFEAQWVIKVTGSNNLPQNPIKRNEYMLQMTSQLAQIANQDLSLARIWLKSIDYPHKDDLYEYLSVLESERQQQAQNPQMSEQQIELERFRQETQIKVKEAVARSVADSLEAYIKEMSKVEGASGETLAALLSKMPEIVNTAFAETLPDAAPQIQQPIEM